MEDSELDAFRQEWRQEAEASAKRRQGGPPLPFLNVSTSPKATNSSIELTNNLDDLHLADASGSQTVGPVKPKTAMEFYQVAVVAEKEGRLNDALSNYRFAFKLDPEADRSYHQASIAPRPAHSDPLPTGAFKFERTVQFGPDYVPEHRSTAAAEEGVGKESGIVDSTHPSSTAFQLTSLLRSIAANPFERNEIDHISAELSSNSLTLASTSLPTKITSSDSPSGLTFIAADPALPVHLASIPSEVLLLILSSLSLTSVIPPPPARIEPVTLARGKKKRLTPREEMLALEIGMGLDPSVLDREWKSDVEALERFSSICRMARVFTLENDAIWRNLVQRTYVTPQILEGDNANSIVREHGNDWRRCYIEHPRLRLDGAYISVVTYLRRGESSQAWYSPTHLITFYRYLRFYPTGIVISLQTVQPPNSVVRLLTPSLRLKGLTIGHWQLNPSDGSLNITGLEDPAVDLPARKYSFRMALKLSSTYRGRMNKLEMGGLSTVRRSDGEVEEVPIRPTKPFFFSKVASYAGEEE